MSYSTLYEVYNTKVNCINEYKNGHGSAPPVWSLISIKHLGREFKMWDDKEAKELWATWKRVDIPRHRRFGLLLTFDTGIIEPDNLNEASELAKKLHFDILENSEWDWSHWEAISGDLEKVAQKHDYRMIGVSLGCTSVSDPWEWYPNGKELFGIIKSLEAQ